MKQNINLPEYKKIYTDMISRKYPEKFEVCKDLLSKKELDSLDIISISEKLFDNLEGISMLNQRHRSYSKSAILKILDYQKKYGFTNTQLAHHFKLSRNTVAKWKRIFI